MLQLWLLLRHELGTGRACANAHLEHEADALVELELDALERRFAHDAPSQPEPAVTIAA